MNDNKQQDKVRKPRREMRFKLGDAVDFDALIKKKGIILKDSPQQKDLTNKINVL